MEYKKNDLLTVTIEDMGHDGEGIGKVDGYTAVSYTHLQITILHLRWNRSVHDRFHKTLD